MSTRLLGSAVVVSGLVALSGCSQVNKVFDNTESVAYKDSKSVKSLEVPPDLTAPQYDSTFVINSNNGTVNASTLNSGAVVGPSGRVAVLPESSTVQIKGTGNVRWLEVSAPADTLWSKVQGFWTTIGASLKRNEPVVGIMETDWIETRGHLPQGFIQEALGSILKNATDSGIRDRYTVRFEKQSSNITKIFITHRGAEQIVTDTGNKWEMRPRRPAAEAEMLNRLKAYLQGIDPKKVTGAPSGAAASSGLAVLTKDKSGQPVLSVGDTYERTWVRTGAALTSTGFTLEGQDSAKGLYAAIWQEEEKKKKGFFSRLIHPTEKFLPVGSQQIISVKKAQNGSELRVLDKEGKPVKSRLATQILERLKVELNR